MMFFNILQNEGHFDFTKAEDITIEIYQRAHLIDLRYQKLKTNMWLMKVMVIKELVFFKSAITVIISR